VPSKRPSGSTKFPPSLARAESEFKKLCDDLGGPADIEFPVDKDYIEVCCREYPVDLVLPILLRFQKDEAVARRHWPSAAFAISQYAFERSERAKYTDEPKPKEIIEILGQIRRSARHLSAGLSELQALSVRLIDPAAPLRRPHLAWLDAFISQAIGGRISNDVTEDDGQIFVDDYKKMGLLRQLADVEIAAKVAKQRVDKSLLNRERGQLDPALPNFILRCGKIWKGLTGRKPSAEKSSSRRDPPFVRFIQELAKPAKLRPPSRNQVVTSLRKFHTCN